MPDGRLDPVAVSRSTTVDDVEAAASSLGAAWRIAAAAVPATFHVKEKLDI